MSSAFRIQSVDQRMLPVARQLHAVQMSAYAQEARLLGAVYFPPLERTVEDVRICAEEFMGAFVGDEIVGAIGVCPEDEGTGVRIASLVVAPQFQRRGIGRGLMAAVLAAHDGEELTVQTGAKNLPALALYAQVGFVELGRWLVGREPLELIKLRRPAIADSSRARNTAYPLAAPDSL
jgi:ribosomal protein S18 acetylase RimI-like enzyme